MKRFILNCMPALVLLVSSCGSKPATDIKDILPQYELSAANDTINYVDKSGLKQGRWIVFKVGPSNLNTSVTKAPDSANTQSGNWESASGKTKVEEGFYTDDKKTGYWKIFAGDGLVKDSVNYN